MPCAEDFCRASVSDVTFDCGVNDEGQDDVNNEKDQYLCVDSQYPKSPVEKFDGQKCRDCRNQARNVFNHPVILTCRRLVRCNEIIKGRVESDDFVKVGGQVNQSCPSGIGRSRARHFCPRQLPTRSGFGRVACRPR